MASRQVTPRSQSDIQSGLERQYSGKLFDPIIALPTQPTEAVVVMAAIAQFCITNNLQAKAAHELDTLANIILPKHQVKIFLDALAEEVNAITESMTKLFNR